MDDFQKWPGSGFEGPDDDDGAIGIVDRDMMMSSKPPTDEFTMTCEHGSSLTLHWDVSKDASASIPTILFRCREGVEHRFG